MGQEIIAGLETAVSLLLNLFMVGSFMWIVGVIMWTFPRMVSNQNIKVRNLLLSGVITGIVLLSILFGPQLIVATINESYDMAMPGMTEFTQKVITDVTEGYDPDYTAVGTAMAEPVITATPDIHADGGAAAPEPAETVVVVETAVYVQPTATMLPTATPTPVVTIAPTFDYSTWKPGTPAPTPMISNGE